MGLSGGWVVVMRMKTARRLEGRVQLAALDVSLLQALLPSVGLGWVETQVFASRNTIFNTKVTPPSISAAGFYGGFNGPGWLVGGEGLRYVSLHRPLFGPGKPSTPPPL